MTVYFFSGLGADQRVFQKLALPQDWRIVHINWPEAQQNDNLNEYCNRISPQIDNTGEYSFVGLSFGGIVAVELSKTFSPKHLIIISSISSRKELSFFYRIVKLFRLHKPIPSRFLTRTTFLSYWLFGIRSKEEKLLLKNVIKETSPGFIKWAINQILSWKNEKRPAGILHIHGDRDKLFSCNRVKADVIIKGGGHFMVYNKAAEISPIIVKQINNIK